MGLLARDHTDENELLQHIRSFEKIETVRADRLRTNSPVQPQVNVQGKRWSVKPVVHNINKVDTVLRTAKSKVEIS